MAGRRRDSCLLMCFNWRNLNRMSDSDRPWRGASFLLAKCASEREMSQVSRDSDVATRCRQVVSTW